jgi:hypothetical protein
MLEKANELDSIREEMEKALSEFENIKIKKSQAKDSLKKAENIMNQRHYSSRAEGVFDNNKKRHWESTLELDTENTNPNVEPQNQFFDSSANVIFQSPVPEDYSSENDLKFEDIESNEVVVNQKDTPNLYSKFKRSLSRGGNRSSQALNPLTESYCSQNVNIERYNSVGNLKIKPKKKKNRNSYRYMNMNGLHSQSLVKNMKVNQGQCNFTEPNSNEPYFEDKFSDHQKSTKMLINCLMQQLNPITAYISDININQSNCSKKETERSRNDNNASMFLDIQERLKGGPNNHLTCTSNFRARTSHCLNFHTKN